MYGTAGRPESFLYALAPRVHFSHGATQITKTRLFKYINLKPKTENVRIKNSDIFHISAQNIDCGYSLKPPWQGGSNEYPQAMFF